MKKGKFSIIALAIILSLWTAIGFVSHQQGSATIGGTNNVNAISTRSTNSAALAGSLFAAVPGPHANTTTLTSPSASLNLPSNGQNLPLTNIFKQAENGVVMVLTNATTSSSTLSTLLANAKNATLPPPGSVGTGFIYDTAGHIITSQSVVKGASGPIEITFGDGNTYSASVIGKDVDSNLAVLQLDKSALLQEKIQPLPLLANSSTADVGQTVFIIGNPFGLSSSLHSGLVSALNRLLPVSGFSIPNGIQFDAIINPGDQGAPVLTLDGKVMGLVYNVFATSTGINFAIPSNAIQKIVPQLIASGTYKHPRLGISGGSITPGVSQELGLPINYKGVVVASVAKGSPAQLAGIKPINPTTKKADIIVGIDNNKVTKIDDIINYVDTKSPGDSIMLHVLRSGSMHDINVILAARPNP